MNRNDINYYTLSCPLNNSESTAAADTLTTGGAAGGALFCTTNLAPNEATTKTSHATQRKRLKHQNSFMYFAVYERLST